MTTKKTQSLMKVDAGFTSWDHNPQRLETKSYNYFPHTYKHHQKKSAVVSDKDRYKTKVKLMF